MDLLSTSTTPAGTGGPMLPPPMTGGPTPKPSPLTSPGMPSAPASSLDAYMNPYRTNVLDTAIREIEDATKQRRNTLGTEAFGAGAFGDARHGIESSELTEDAMKTIGDLTGQINAQGFESGMGWLNTDLDRQTSTAFNNASLDNQWLQNQMQLMGLGSGLDQNAIANSMGFTDALLGLDEYDRGYLQEDLNVGYEDFLAEQGWGDNRLGVLQSILSGIPIGQNTTTTSPSSGWSNIIGSLFGGK